MRFFRALVIQEPPFLLLIEVSFKRKKLQHLKLRERNVGITVAAGPFFFRLG